MYVLEMLHELSNLLNNGRVVGHDGGVVVHLQEGACTGGNSLGLKDKDNASIKGRVKSVFKCIFFRHN